MKYVYIDINDKIEAVTSKQLDPREGFTEIAVEDDIVSLSGNEYITYEGGEIVKNDMDPSVVEDLVRQRKLSIGYKADRQYPSWQKQADMQYWDAINGTTIWIDTITAIKEANPKPTGSN